MKTKFYKYEDVKPPKSGFYWHISEKCWYGDGRKPIINEFVIKEDGSYPRYDWPMEEQHCHRGDPLYWAYIDYPELPVEAKKKESGKTFVCPKCEGRGYKSKTVKGTFFDIKTFNIHEKERKLCNICEGLGLTAKKMVEVKERIESISYEVEEE